MPERIAGRRSPWGTSRDERGGRNQPPWITLREPGHVGAKPERRVPSVECRKISLGRRRAPDSIDINRIAGRLPLGLPLSAQRVGRVQCWGGRGRAWAYGCKIEEQDPPTPTAQQRAPSCPGNRHRSLPPRSSFPALSVPTSCTRSRSCSGVSAFVNQHGGPSSAKACRVIRSASGHSSSGRTLRVHQEAGRVWVSLL